MMAVKIILGVAVVVSIAFIYRHHRLREKLIIGILTLIIAITFFTPFVWMAITEGFSK